MSLNGGEEEKPEIGREKIHGRLSHTGQVWEDTGRGSGKSSLPFLGPFKGDVGLKGG